MRQYGLEYKHLGVRPAILALIGVLTIALFGTEAKAQQLKISSDEVRFYQKWMNLSGTCNVPISGKQDDSFRACVSDILSRVNSSENAEDRLEYFVYKSIKKEIDNFEDFSKAVREKIISGYSSDSGLEPIFGKDASRVSKGAYEKVVAYFFLGSTPIVSVTPIFTYDIMFYNPYLDMAYFMNFKKEGGAYLPQDGFFEFGNTLRDGRPPDDLPSWLKSNDNIANIPEIVLQTIEGSGRTDLFKKNLKYATQDNSITYGRVFAFINTLKRQSECSKSLIKRFNDDAINLIKAAKVTNITIDQSELKGFDFRIIANIYDKDGNETSFLVSSNSPSQLVSITNGRAYCSPEKIQYVDALENFFKMAADMAISAETKRLKQ